MGIIVDIVIGAIFLIALIVGVAMGLCKQFSRPLVGIVALAGAIFLTGLIYPLFAVTSPMISFVTAVSGWFKPEMYTTVIADAEGLRQTMSGSYLTILNGLADKMFPYMERILANTGLEITLGNFFGKIIVNVLIEFVLWLTLYLSIKYLLFGIRYLLKKITSVVVFKSIDKVFGLIWSVVLTYIIVVGVVLTAVELVINLISPDLGNTVASLIGGTTLLKFFHNTNILGSFLAGLFGQTLLVLP